MDETFVTKGVMLSFVLVFSRRLGQVVVSMRRFFFSFRTLHATYSTFDSTLHQRSIIHTLTAWTHAVVNDIRGVERGAGAVGEVGSDAREPEWKIWDHPSGTPLTFNRLPKKSEAHPMCESDSDTDSQVTPQSSAGQILDNSETSKHL